MSSILLLDFHQARHVERSHQGLPCPPRPLPLASLRPSHSSHCSAQHCHRYRPLVNLPIFLISTVTSPSFSSLPLYLHLTTSPSSLPPTQAPPPPSQVSSPSPTTASRCLPPPCPSLLCQVLAYTSAGDGHFSSSISCATESDGQSELIITMAASYICCFMV